MHLSNDAMPSTRHSGSNVVFRPTLSIKRFELAPYISGEHRDRGGDVASWVVSGAGAFGSTDPVYSNARLEGNHPACV